MCRAFFTLGLGLLALATADAAPLIEISISPEGRVKASAGEARPALVQGGWAEFEMVIDNGAGLTSPLAVESRQFLQAADDRARDRWLRLEVVPPGPLTGQREETRALRLWSRDAGRRAAVFNFNAGQGSQDLGFRSDVLLTFVVAAAGAEPPPQPIPPPDLSAEGWYAGDLHVHRGPQEMEGLMKQSGLHIASVITWWNEANVWKARPVPPAPVGFDDGRRFYHPVGGEDERTGGALLFHNLTAPLDITGSSGAWPPSVRFLREAKAAGAWCDIEKPFWQDVPLWLVSGLVDSVGICHNHLQIGGMLDGEAWGRARDRNRYPGPHGNGFYTQDLYYHILNSGLRLPPTAGGASGVLPNPVGYNRVYVQCDAPLTWEKWWQGLQAGRVFVGNGPQLRVQAEGRWPGHVFTPEAPATVTLDGRLDSADPIGAVELVHNGVVSRITLPHRLEVAESGWFLVRAITTVPHTFRFASTAPWYVEMKGKPFHPRAASARLFLEWSRDRLKALEHSPGLPPDAAAGAGLEAIQPWREAVDFWQAHLDRAEEANPGLPER